MNFSYNWIRELVDGLDLSPLELERLITMKTAECEGIAPAGELLAEACAARVLSVEPIPDSHNVKAVAETERYGTKVVVCGARNCRPGMSTVYVPLPPKTIQGIESQGMLASGAELGINRDGLGIVELNGPFDLKPDSIIEIDNKSITHRPDLWGHHGMAREVGAFSGKPVRDPANLNVLPAGAPAIQVDIEDLRLCPRYSALVFDNVTVGPSPLWLQYRLETIGLNPINNIVDFTNYVMAELGQPTHAFDKARLRGETIFIRPARESERVAALNDEDYELTPANLVIADESGPIALAGVIGGRDSAISESTTGIVLESACFLASSIRKTSSLLKIRTDASMRFEKSQDPANTVRALARAVELLQELSPGIRLVGGLADRQAPQEAREPILLPMDWLARKLGRAVPMQEVRQILESLEFGVTEIDTKTLQVLVPSWRATKDISIKDDLVEEVGRMIGYGSIEPRPPMVAASVPPANGERTFLREVRAVMTGQGFTETCNYSFISEEQASRLGLPPEQHLRVANPIASDQSLMRLSLLPGLLRQIEDNQRHYESFRLFEIGKEIHPRPQELPDEVPHLAAVIRSAGDGKAELFEMKRVAECLMPGATVRPTEARPFEHPARTAEVRLRDRVVGRLAELHPSIAEGRATILDIDLRAMREAQKEPVRYSPPRRFPSSAFDLSVIAGIRELTGELHSRLEELVPKTLLDRIEYVRQYAGSPLRDDQKSVSFRITVAAPDRTLLAEDVARIRQTVIDGMRAKGYELRV